SPSNAYLEKIDAQMILKKCLRYLDHKDKCSEAVCFEDNCLLKRLQKLDLSLNPRFVFMPGRQDKYWNIKRLNPKADRKSRRPPPHPGGRGRDRAEAGTSRVPATREAEAGALEGESRPGLQVYMSLRPAWAREPPRPAP
uniref:Uncharacterized protein n=1 Tax=Macaca fascicularis TaxID=9541 RepID=A0A7N9CJF2_MACFA